jgi:hypothetical protein
MRRLACLLTMCANCTGGHETPDSRSDAAVDAVPPRCDLRADFGPPAVVSDLDTAADEECARFTGDGLTVVFSRWSGDASGDWGIWIATRTSTAAPFAAAEKVTAVDTAGVERCPAISADGLELYFWRYTVGLRVSVRAAVSDPFPADSTLPVIGNNAGRVSPYVLPDHTMYLAAASSSGSFLAVAPWTEQGFTGPDPLPGADLPGPTIDTVPVLTPDGLTLFYASDRPGGSGLTDIWTATRAVPGGAFGPSTNVASLNTPDYDYPSWISADGCELGFSRWTVDRRFELMTALRGH